MQPNLEHVIVATNARAARVEERCSHVVVGYVTQHHALAKRSIVVDGQVRWFPNDDEFQRMMGWKKHPDGPGIPHPGWPLDESPAPAPVAVPVAAPAAPSRPVLTAPPSAKLLESTEAALGQLAHELGCVYDVSVPHNAGWFVPGKATACASAYDAIRGLVASLKTGGTVYEPKSAAPAIAEPVLELELVPVEVPKRKPAPAPAIEQGALF
jgi:hypothetical protein